MFLSSNSWLSVTFDKTEVTEIKLWVLWQRLNLGKDLASHERLVKYFPPQPLSEKLRIKILTYYFFSHSCGVLALHLLPPSPQNPVHICRNHSTKTHKQPTWRAIPLDISKPILYYLFFPSPPPPFILLLWLFSLFKVLAAHSVLRSEGTARFFFCFFFK